MKTIFLQQIENAPHELSSLESCVNIYLIFEWTELAANG